MLPITLAPELNTDTPPTAYMIHRFTQHCANCTRTHSWCEWYSVLETPSRTRLTTTRHLIPTTKFHYDVPIICHDITPRHVPACHACLDTLSLQNKPTAYRDWMLTLQKKKLEATQVPAPKITLSADDFD